jgi:hypothetical protein
MTDPLRRFSPWFYAAAVYNLAWGSMNVVAPTVLTGALGIRAQQLVAWRVVGLLVLVYAPGFWWAARRPSRQPHLIAIACLGKLLGPVGFAWAAATGALPLTFGLTIVTNDLIWLPAFGLYLRAAARPYGGLRALLSGAEEANEDRPEPASGDGRALRLGTKRHDSMSRAAFFASAGTVAVAGLANTPQPSTPV